MTSLPIVGLWIHTCGAYTRYNRDGSAEIVKTASMGPSSTYEVMPEGFTPPGYTEKPALPVLQGCAHSKRKPHSCPFKSEINNDETTLCTCCKNCEHECAMDI